jgi:hypothetical protein
MESTNAVRVRQYRQRLRESGMKPVQFWVPDPRAPHFAETMERQCRAINASAGEQEALDFCEEAAAEIEGWV